MFQRKSASLTTSVLSDARFLWYRFDRFRPNDKCTLAEIEGTGMLIFTAGLQWRKKLAGYPRESNPRENISSGHCNPKLPVSIIVVIGIVENNWEDRFFHSNSTAIKVNNIRTSQWWIWGCNVWITSFPLEDFHPINLYHALRQQIILLLL